MKLGLELVPASNNILPAWKMIPYALRRKEVSSVVSKYSERGCASTRSKIQTSVTMSFIFAGISQIFFFLCAVLGHLKYLHN